MSDRVHDDVRFASRRWAYEKYGKYQERKFEWWRIKSGPFRRQTLPQIALNHPDVFFKWIAGDFLWGDLGRQADIVRQRASHILPPKRRRRNWQFEIAYKPNGELAHLAIVKRTSTGRAGPHVFYAAHLDLSIVQSCPNPRQASLYASDWVKREFFGVEGRELMAYDANRFFETDSHFNLFCRVSHNNPWIRGGR